MRKLRIILIALAAVVATGVVAVKMALPRIDEWAAGFHQKSVTRSLAKWAVEDAKITNDASAIHAAEMIGYMSSYYVPGPGYRGPEKIEAALDKQRRESIARVVDSLGRYTGLDYGTNAERWTEWAEARKRSQLDGTTNRSRPFRLETNSASSTGGTNR